MKTELRTTILALVPGILALAVAACSSDDTTTPKTTTGTAGATGSTTSAGTTGSTVSTGSTSSTTSTSTTSGGAGSTTTAAGSGGSAGATGAGGAGTGGAGTGGAGGAAGCSAPTTATGLISDFATMNVANQLTGGTDTWYTPGTATVTAGVMHFTAPATAFGNAVSALIASRPGMIGCVDLTGYTSISFKISSPTNTMMLFEITSKEVAMMPDGSGYRTSFPVTPTLTTQTIMLSSLVAPGFGIGAMQAAMPGFNILQDAAAIVLAEPTANMGVDIMVDDVTFQ